MQNNDLSSIRGVLTSLDYVHLCKDMETLLRNPCDHLRSDNSNKDRLLSEAYEKCDTDHVLKARLIAWSTVGRLRFIDSKRIGRLFLTIADRVQPFVPDKYNDWDGLRQSFCFTATLPTDNPLGYAIEELSKRAVLPLHFLPLAIQTELTDLIAVYLHSFLDRWGFDTMHDRKWDLYQVTELLIGQQLNNTCTLAQLQTAALVGRKTRSRDASPVRKNKIKLT